MVFAADGLLSGGEGAASPEAPSPVVSDAAATPPADAAAPADTPPAEAPKADAKAERKISPKSALDEDPEDLPADDEAKPEETAKEGDEAKPEPVFKPEDIKLPEDMSLDQLAMDRFAPILNELNLPADKAQPLVDAYIEMRKAEVQAFEDGQVQMKKMSMDDPDIGKAQWKDTITKARKAIDVYGNQDFKDLLGLSGIANHPATLRFLRQVGATAMDDTPVSSEVAAGQKRDAVDILYPNQKG
jgi:hypothetical protein